MTEHHPLTPPPELVRQWTTSFDCPEAWGPKDQWIASKAAQWGADQELEECCEWVSKYLPYLGDFPMPEDKLRDARRPKPPSLKEQALGLLNEGPVSELLDHEVDTIRRALEQLDD